MEYKPEMKEKLVREAMELAAELGWEFLTLRDVAERGGISLAELRMYFADKSDILTALGAMIDREVLGQMEDLDPAASPRDVLFDVMMERFDVLNRYRAGIVSVFHSFRLEPKQALLSMPHLFRSMEWMLEAAGIDSNGFKGAAKVVGLTGVYLKGVRVWIKDDSPDMGKTMAELDKALGRAEKMAGYIGL